MNPILIAFHGLPGSGKDTAANSLIEHADWVKVSFAAPLKRGLVAMLGIPIEDIENHKIKNEPNYMFGKSIRYMAQTIGTEWGRNLIADDIWVQLAENSIRHSWRHGSNVANTDLRFENEAIRIKELGGYIVHIIRDANEHSERQNETGAVNHTSNVTLPAKYIDYTIHNNGSLEMFYSEIVKIMYDISMKDSNV